MDLRALGVVGMGLALPTIANALYNKVSTSLNNVPGVGMVTGNAYGRAALGTLLAGGVAYLVQSMNPVTMQEAALGATIATTMFAVGALAQSGMMPTWLTNALPAGELSGYSGAGYIGGYSSGGYLGYLGNIDEDMPTDGGNQPMLYGVGSAPAVNVF